jgi:hypothetical protein
MTDVDRSHFPSQISRLPTGQVRSHLSGNPTYQDLAAWSDDKFRLAASPGVCGSIHWKRSGPLDEAELCEGGDTVVQPDLFKDLAFFQLEHGRASEMHLPSRRQWQ